MWQKDFGSHDLILYRYLFCDYCARSLDSSISRDLTSTQHFPSQFHGGLNGCTREISIISAAGHQLWSADHVDVDVCRFIHGERCTLSGVERGSVKLVGLGIDSDEVGAFYSDRFGMMWFVHDEGDDIHHGIALSDFNSCEKAVQWHCNLLSAVRCVGWAVI